MEDDCGRKVRIPSRDTSLLNDNSHHYVHKITSNLPPNALKLATRVSSVAPINVKGKQMLTVTTEAGASKTYDHVIMACQSYASREILKKGGSITGDEERILGGFSWTKNEAVLHADESVSGTCGDSSTTLLTLSVHAREPCSMVSLELLYQERLE